MAITGNTSEPNIKQITHAMSVAMVAAKATEQRAALLLHMAKASPATLHRAREIYARAKVRTDRLSRALGLLVVGFPEPS